MLVEDSSLNSVKVAGMVMCILGVAVHSGLKALRLRGSTRFLHLSYITTHCLYVSCDIM